MQPISQGHRVLPCAIIFVERGAAWLDELSARLIVRTMTHVYDVSLVAYVRVKLS